MYQLFSCNCTSTTGWGLIPAIQNFKKFQFGNYMYMNDMYMNA